MDTNTILKQLAQRMDSTEAVAEQWLQATVETLHQHFAEKSASAAPATQTTEAALGAAILRGYTPATRECVDAQDIKLEILPFRVGRETRSHAVEAIPGLIERRGESFDSVNDLYVRDTSRPLNVSREHFQIERGDGGGYALVDRGSACGTIVGDQLIGGNYTGGRCSLQHGDAIVVGSPESTIVFEFLRQRV